jgi:hypothetical protein
VSAIVEGVGWLLIAAGVLSAIRGWFTGVEK